jgi:acid phosphatase
MGAPMFTLFRRYAAIIVGVLLSFSIYATEPTNLQIIKDQLMAYHDSGSYEQDISKVTQQAADYLHQVVSQNKDKKLAIVFDIDETALSNYAHMTLLNFGGTLSEIDRLINQSSLPAIAPTLALYQQAKLEHVHVFFITGRRDTPHNRENVERNLRNVGFTQYDGLSMKPLSYQEKSASPYKTATRKKIAEQGYDIVLNIGDQMSDLKGGYADKTYKLPNPYYYVP